jgi:hypothetical protein
MMTSLIQVEKLYQDYVWITQTHSIDTASVDAWEAVVREYISHINAPHRYMVYDLTAIPRPGVTIYMNRRVTALSRENPDAFGRVGIALNLNPTVRYVFEPFIRFASSQFQPALSIRLFPSRETALDWVVEALPAEIREAGA